MQILSSSLLRFLPPVQTSLRRSDLPHMLLRRGCSLQTPAAELVPNEKTKKTIDTLAPILGHFVPPMLALHRPGLILLT